MSDDATPLGKEIIEGLRDYRDDPTYARETTMRSISGDPPKDVNRKTLDRLQSYTDRLEAPPALPEGLREEAKAARDEFLRRCKDPRKRHALTSLETDLGHAVCDLLELIPLFAAGEGATPAAPEGGVPMNKDNTRRAHRRELARLDDLGDHAALVRYVRSTVAQIREDLGDESYDDSDRVIRADVDLGDLDAMLAAADELREGGGE
ncbi:MAG: hypothetical protein AAF532_17460 [Planctomycetota bacterium]